MDTMLKWYLELKVLTMCDSFPMGIKQTRGRMDFDNHLTSNRQKWINKNKKKPYGIEMPTYFVTNN